LDSFTAALISNVKIAGRTITSDGVKMLMAKRRREGFIKEDSKRLIEKGISGMIFSRNTNFLSILIEKCC